MSKHGTAILLGVDGGVQVLQASYVGASHIILPWFDDRASADLAYESARARAGDTLGRKTYRRYMRLCDDVVVYREVPEETVLPRP